MNMDNSEHYMVNSANTRFEIRKSDYAIIDTQGDVAPIMVDMMSSEDGSESGYSDRASVVNLLNTLYNNSFESDEFSLPIHDYALNVERKLIILEKIMEEMNRIARVNFKESKEFKKMRDEQFLIEIQNHYEKLFDEAYKSLHNIKQEC